MFFVNDLSFIVAVSGSLATMCLFLLFFARKERKRLLRLLNEKEKKISSLQEENASTRSEKAVLNAQFEREKEASQEKLSIFDSAQKKLSDAFKALSSDALKNNAHTFLEMAAEKFDKLQVGAKHDLTLREHSINDLVKPIRDALEKVQDKIQQLERARTSAYTSLHEQIKSLATSQCKLQSETANLARALRTPNVRGRWGEIQLRRVVEIAGMLEHCDFLEQKTFTTETGRLRPDMIVNLPNKKQIVVDAKTSLQAYLEALEAEDDEKKESKLKDHCRHVKNHIVQLSTKAYWSQFQKTPEFVVLFIPGETFFSAALAKDAGLIEYGMKRRIIIATPTTLIALLQAVACGWSQEDSQKNVEGIIQNGKNLYERLKVMATHFEEMRKNLDRTVTSYNQAVGSFEGRVLTAARKFKDLGQLNSQEIDTPLPITTTTRQIKNDLMDEVHSKG